MKEINDNNFFIKIDKILSNINFDQNIVFETIKESIYPNILIDGYSIVPHEDGLHIITIKPLTSHKINIVFKKESNALPQQKQSSKLKLDVDRNDMNMATLALYSSMDSTTFNTLMIQIMESDVLDETQEYISECLFKQGVLIENSELKSFRLNENKYIGYINIFNIKNDLDMILYNKNDKKYRDATNREKEELMRSRQKYPDVPSDMTQEILPWGVFAPKSIKDKNVVMNVFKIFTTGESAGKKTGIDCTSLKKNEHIAIFKELNINHNDGTKIKNCNTIANTLLLRGRLTLLPKYKPRQF
jgi:hypothetical protein